MDAGTIVLKAAPRVAFRPTRGDLAVAAYCIVFLATLAILPPGPGVLRIISAIAYFGIGLATMVAQWRLARGHDADRGSRLAWGWLAASSACIVVAGGAWTAWLEIHPGVPQPDWTGWIVAMYMPCAIAGMLAFPRERAEWRDRRRVLDVLLLTVCGFALSWHYSFLPLFAGDTPVSAMDAVTVAGELLVFVTASVVVIGARDLVVRRAAGIFLAAQVAFTLADYAWSEVTKAYAPGDLVDAFYFLTWMLRWISARYAWYAGQARVETGGAAGGGSDGASEGAPDGPAYRSGIAPTAFVAGAYVVLGVEVLLNGRHAIDVAIFTSLMTALLLARQQVELATNRRLSLDASAQAQRFRALLARTTDYIAVLDDTHRVKWTSPSLGAPDLSGMRPSVDDLVHPDDRANVHRWLSTRGAVRAALPIECRMRSARGAWVDVELRLDDRRDDPTVAGIVLNGRDISGELALEGRLRHAEKLATLHEMAGRIAHAFNNTLAVIAGHAELLADELGDTPQQLDDVAAIRAAADRGAGITRQLLGFSGRHVIQPVRLRLADTIEALAPALGRSLPVGITLDLALAVRDAVILCDRGQFEQVLVNLVANARDAMPDGGVIAVGLSAGMDRETPGPEVVLHVRDSGTGIASGDLEHIFTPFFTTKVSGRGTGLGLPMVEAIVRRAGGRIAVTSAVDAGTSVAVHFPRVIDDVAPRTGVAADPLAARGRGFVLLVDDEPGVRTVGRRLLARAGYTVIEASGGAEAIAILATPTQAIDVIVTDMMMPGVSGREVIARAAVLRPGTPIVVVTGFASQEDQHESMAPAVSMILAKPFSAAAFVGAVAKALGGT